MFREPVCPTGQPEVQLEPEGACSGVNWRTFLNPWPSALQVGLAVQQDLRVQAGLVPAPPKELPQLCPLIPILAALPGTIPQPMNMYPQKYFRSEKKETASRVCR